MIGMMMQLSMGMQGLQQQGLLSQSAPAAAAAAAVGRGGEAGGGVAGAGIPAAGSSRSTGVHLPRGPSAAARQELQQFSVRSSTVKTVPRLVQLWLEGWPLDVQPPQKAIQPLAAGYSTAAAMASRDKQALDLLRQGYLFVSELSQRHGLDLTGGGCLAVRRPSNGQPRG